MSSSAARYRKSASRQALTLGSRANYSVSAVPIAKGPLIKPRPRHSICVSLAHPGRGSTIVESAAVTTKPFHLAWFLQGSSVQAWGEPWTGNISEDWMSAEMFLDLARAIERACFDYMLLEDSIYIGQNWQNSREIFLKNGMSV